MATTKDRTAVLPDGASIVVEVDGATMTLPLNAREFKTGSIGYHVQGKVVGADARRYQLNVTATLIGSKPVAS